MIIFLMISNSDISKTADKIVNAIQKGDFKSIMKYADKRGVIFSINPVVDTTDPKISPEVFRNILNDTTRRFWGYASGSGKEIYMTFREFYANYLKKDYLKGKKSINKRIANTKIKDNIRDVFKNATFVEYYLKGKGEYDWHSLIIVFDGDRLVAILHDSYAP